MTGVSVSLGASALLIGQTTQATAEVDVIGTADDTVLWSSSNDTVLTVSADGEVTAVSEGEADVIATSTFDDTRTGSAAVTVAPVPAVLSVTVSVSQPSLLLSETATATADVQVVGTATTGVSWSSSDEGVLIVDQAGLVTPVARGTAEVIATSAHDATVRGTSAVQVLEPVVLSISLSKPYDDWMTDEGHWFLADGAFDATATVTTQDASEEVVWSSSDDAIFTVDGSGRVTPLARGTATLTATSTVDPSMSASLSVRVFVPAMSSYTQLALVHLSGTWTAEWIGQVGATASVWSSATSITGTDLDYLNYVFSIQDASMASVTSDGLVTLLSPGSTSLTVRALRRPGGSAILTATHDLIVNP